MPRYTQAGVLKLSRYTIIPAMVNKVKILWKLITHAIFSCFAPPPKSSVMKATKS